jgi:hypothetical protein
MSGKFERHTEEELTAFALGELDKDRAAEIEQLLRDDPQGRQTVDELRGIAEFLSEQLAYEPLVELTDTQRRAVESGDIDEKPATRLQLRFRLKTPLTLAASILVMLGAMFLVVNYQPAPTTEVVADPVDPAPKLVEDIPTDIEYPKAEYQGTLPPATSKPRKPRKRVKKVPLVVKYPVAEFGGTPVPVNEPNIEKPTGKPPVTAMLPRGTVNLAAGKPVSSNELLPVVGTLDMVTDGSKSGKDGFNVDLGFGRKWVQIDLQSVCSVSAVGVWHYHKEARAYRDVIVQMSNDPDFIKYTTIFNSDHDNSSGMGIGEDFGYVETRHGRFIWCPKPQTARYVRLYSKGNTSNDQNHYIEVEIYGRAPAGKVPTTQPTKKKKTPTTQPSKKKNTPTTQPAKKKKATTTTQPAEATTTRVRHS